MAFDDIAGIEDLDIDEVVRGAAAIAEAFGRRITTPSGGLDYDPAYVSTDLGAWQSRALSSSDVYRLRVDLERCRDAERRIASATIDVAYFEAGMELRVTVNGVTVDGDTFELSATVDGEGVQLAVAA